MVWSPRQAELGYHYVYDPQFAYANFLTARGDLRAGSMRISPAAWLALDDNNQRFLLETAYRPWGRTPGRRAGDGSYVDLAMGLRYEREVRLVVATCQQRCTGPTDTRCGAGFSCQSTKVQPDSELYKTVCEPPVDALLCLPPRIR